MNRHVSTLYDTMYAYMAHNKMTLTQHCVILYDAM